MKLIMRASIAVAIAVAMPMETAYAQSTCPGFVNGRAYPPELNEFYGMLAVQIVSAGKREDVAELNGLVSQGATFSIIRGDYGSSARRTGVEGVLEMTRDLKPVHFQILSEAVGPILLIQDSKSECRYQVTVLFQTEQSSTGVRMLFEFFDGMLARAVGNEVKITEGDVR